MGGLGRLGEQYLEDFQSGASAQLCRLDDTGEDGDVSRSGFAARPEADLAEDDQGAQGALRMVVGGWPAATNTEGQTICRPPIRKG